MSFDFHHLQIQNVVLIEPQIYPDERGLFAEIYHRSEFKKAGTSGDFVQDNQARSRKGVLRGLHYQKEPMAQGKLIRCARGAVFDVAVDLRKDSDTFGKWVSVTLSEANRHILWIPRGFAHGYQALQNDSEVLYKVDNYYSPGDECGLIWNDPDLAIPWPIAPPIISPKDSGFPCLSQISHG